MSPQFLVVPKGEGEVIRKKLLEMDALNKALRIESEAENLLLPVTREVDLGFELIRREGRKIEKAPESYKELIEVPRELRPLLPTSFDVIGQVIVIKLAEELAPFSNDIGRAMMEAYKAIRTVAVDEGVRGDFRVRTLRVICGDEPLRTVHRAYGVGLEVDLSECYFSPRIATETWRIAQQVGTTEVVVDMFSGVGPFALTIAKHAKPAKVYAIDSNPHAVRYLEKNIARNKVLNVKAILDDSRAATERIRGATRAIIDLPHSSMDYLAPAVRAVEKGFVHYYEILDVADVEDRIESLGGIARDEVKTISLAGTRRVRTFSPSEAHFVFDLEVQ
jgi:tRNA (guanine37-N1)-methyltransferase